jgi:hypothetical protein
MSAVDLVVIHEHPEWQKPLFAALDRRGLHWQPFDLKRAAFSPDVTPEAKLYFNQASPSAYLRGNTRAVPLALAYLRCLEAAGKRVLNGSGPFSLDLSKSAQAALLRRLDVPAPRCIVFNDLDALRANLNGWSWPTLLKPEQGGSGARMFFLFRERKGPARLPRRRRPRRPSSSSRIPRCRRRPSPSGSASAERPDSMSAASSTWSRVTSGFSMT